MHCTLVRNGFCPLCYGEGERKRRRRKKVEEVQLPEPIIGSTDNRFFPPPVNQIMQKVSYRV
jgi:hypothetical protein